MPVEKLFSSCLLSKNLKVRIYKTVILPVVLYGCETWTLTLREEQRLRVFENKALRKIFGAKRDEVTGEWRKLQNAELHALYSSPDIIGNIKSRRLRWAGDVARMGESRNAYRVLVGRPDGIIRLLGRPRRRWEDNIKMDLREVEYDAVYRVTAHLFATSANLGGRRQNKVLRKIFGAKRDEVTGEWRKLHNAELHALYYSPDIIRNIKSRRLRWAGHIARMGESRNSYRVLVGRPEGKIPLGRPRRRWEDNIEMDLREMEYDDRGWINLLQDRDRWRARWSQSRADPSSGNSLHYPSLVCDPQNYLTSTGTGLKNPGATRTSEENVHRIQEAFKRSPQKSAFCPSRELNIPHVTVYSGNTISENSCLEMLQDWLFPQMTADSEDFIFQQDGAPPHWHCEVRRVINETMSHRWIGRT
ncbi:hypothetical protein ANN_21343 [Periplaneta americana]|uniref:Uncharacterized protein n=1 Tax=Periplaneta americana TaxID=6978 RepID=A0ABQ8SFX5_PERAM|nr:hypothetical protein ANN_21343 [Periplaneta americana]